MILNQVIKRIKAKYPNKNIVKNDESNPTEIICEIDPTSEHPEYSKAIAVILKSKPHYHRTSTETYEIVKGKLTVVKNGETFSLKIGDKLMINPAEVHYAFAGKVPAWVNVTSRPGWTPKDYYLVRDIPYVGAPENACALACYTMVAKYFFPETTFEKIAKISNWEKGYVVWAFRFWRWIMDKGIKVEDYDLISLKAWADEGTEGLKKSASEKEFNFYKSNTKNLEKLTDDIRKVIRHKNFTYHQQKPTFSDLLNAFRKGGVCEVVLDSRTLDGKKGFSLHRVVILDVSDNFVVFHDPIEIPRPARKVSAKLFRKAWLGVVSQPELCVYRK